MVAISIIDANKELVRVKANRSTHLDDAKHSLKKSAATEVFGDLYKLRSLIKQRDIARADNLPASAKELGDRIQILSKKLAKNEKVLGKLMDAYQEDLYHNEGKELQAMRGVREAWSDLSDAERAHGVNFDVPSADEIAGMETHIREANINIHGRKAIMEDLAKGADSNVFMLLEREIPKDKLNEKQLEKRNYRMGDAACDQAYAKAAGKVDSWLQHKELEAKADVDLTGYKNQRPITKAALKTAQQNYRKVGGFFRFFKRRYNQNAKAAYNNYTVAKSADMVVKEDTKKTQKIYDTAQKTTAERRAKIDGEISSSLPPETNRSMQEYIKLNENGLNTPAGIEAARGKFKAKFEALRDVHKGINAKVQAKLVPVVPAAANVAALPVQPAQPVAQRASQLSDDEWNDLEREINSVGSQAGDEPAAQVDADRNDPVPVPVASSGAVDDEVNALLEEPSEGADLDAVDANRVSVQPATQATPLVRPQPMPAVPDVESGDDNDVDDTVSLPTASVAAPRIVIDEAPEVLPGEKQPVYQVGDLNISPAAVNPAPAGLTAAEHGKPQAGEAGGYQDSPPVSHQLQDLVQRINAMANKLDHMKLSALSAEALSTLNTEFFEITQDKSALINIDLSADQWAELNESYGNLLQNLTHYMALLQQNQQFEAAITSTESRLNSGEISSPQEVIDEIQAFSDRLGAMLAIEPKSFSTTHILFQKHVENCLDNLKRNVAQNGGVNITASEMVNELKGRHDAWKQSGDRRQAKTVQFDEGAALTSTNDDSRLDITEQSNANLSAIAEITEDVQQLIAQVENWDISGEMLDGDTCFNAAYEIIVRAEKENPSKKQAESILELVNDFSSKAQSKIVLQSLSQMTDLVLDEIHDRINHGEVPAPDTMLNNIGESIGDAREVINVIMTSLEIDIDDDNFPDEAHALFTAHMENCHHKIGALKADLELSANLSENDISIKMFNKLYDIHNNWKQSYNKRQSQASQHDESPLAGKTQRQTGNLDVSLGDITAAREGLRPATNQHGDPDAGALQAGYSASPAAESREYRQDSLRVTSTTVSPKSRPMASMSLNLTNVSKATIARGAHALPTPRLTTKPDTNDLLDKTTGSMRAEQKKPAANVNPAKILKSFNAQFSAKLRQLDKSSDTELTTIKEAIDKLKKVYIGRREAAKDNGAGNGFEAYTPIIQHLNHCLDKLEAEPEGKKAHNGNMIEGLKEFHADWIEENGLGTPPLPQSQSNDGHPPKKNGGMAKTASEHQSNTGDTPKFDKVDPDKQKRGPR